MSVAKHFTVDNTLRDDRILRRYLDLAKFIELLRTQSLYLRRGDLFQDKFEGSFTPSVRFAIEEAYKASGSTFSYEKFKKELREGVYINCWSLGANDNMALWNLYGKSEASVAITTTVGKLKRELTEQKVHGHLSLLKVEYIKHWRDPKVEIIPYAKIFRYKVVAYDFEREVRIILDRFERNFKQCEKDEGILLSIQLNKFLRSVVVSPLAPPWFVDLIKDLAHRYGVTAPARVSDLASEPI